MDVRAAIFKDGKLLLVRELSDGGWTMPGGWADVGDVPSQAAEHEAWEEAGLRVKACKLIGVYDSNRIEPLTLFHCFKLVFLCDLLGGEAGPSLETTEVSFFGSNEEFPWHCLASALAFATSRMLSWPYEIHIVQPCSIESPSIRR